MTWHAFQDGRTFGHAGSEGGTIILDEECEAGARISLERARHARFAITCGVYGLLVHTRFFETEGEARNAIETMKQRLETIASLPSEDDYIPAAAAFVEEFP